MSLFSCCLTLFPLQKKPHLIVTHFSKSIQSLPMSFFFSSLGKYFTKLEFYHSFSNVDYVNLESIIFWGEMTSGLKCILLESWFWVWHFLALLPRTSYLIHCASVHSLYITDFLLALGEIVYMKDLWSLWKNRYQLKIKDESVQIPNITSSTIIFWTSVGPWDPLKTTAVLTYRPVRCALHSPPPGSWISYR